MNAPYCELACGGGGVWDFTVLCLGRAMGTIVAPLY